MFNMKSFTRILLAGVTLGMFAVPLRAEVVDSSAHGFTVRSTVIVQGPPKQAYERFVREVGKWWDSNHTYTGESSNLSIDAQLGGSFSEKLPGGGFVEHMRVVYADPGKILRMVGGLGPLQELGAAGAMTISFAEIQTSTEVTMTYAVGGYMKQGLGSLAAIVNSVLALQLNRYKAHVDSHK